MICVNRWFLKLRMRDNKRDAQDHPATSAVKNYLSGSERCLVVWGLSNSRTNLCCQSIARGIIHEKGLAKIFRCDEIARASASLKQVFLDTLACKTLDDFVACLPTPGHHVWLIFDAIDQLNAETTAFFQVLITLSYESAKFKLLLVTHKTGTACSILRWSDSLNPIQIVQPFGCCRWKDQPGVLSEAASDLEAQWTLGITRLNRFVQEQWAQSGAFTICTERY